MPPRQRLRTVRMEISHGEFNPNFDNCFLFRITAGGDPVEARLQNDPIQQCHFIHMLQLPCTPALLRI